MNRSEVYISALAESQSQKDNYVVILEEPLSRRRVPIVIGEYEAQALALHLENFETSRPLTHAFLKNTIDLFGYKVKEVYINRFDNDIFYAILTYVDKNNTTLELDVRPSDGFVLAVRYDAPIYINNDVLEITGYEIEEKGTEKKGSYAEFTMEELENLLNNILKKEDYESAARVRDAIEKRKRLQ